MGTMGFVHEDDDGVTLVEEPEGLLVLGRALGVARFAGQVRVNLAVLLNHGEDQARTRSGQQLLHFRHRLADVDRLTCQSGSFAELTLEVCTVRHGYDPVSY